MKKIQIQSLRTYTYIFSLPSSLGYFLGRPRRLICATSDPSKLQFALSGRQCQYYKEEGLLRHSLMPGAPTSLLFARDKISKVRDNIYNINYYNIYIRENSQRRPLYVLHPMLRCIIHDPWEISSLPAAFSSDVYSWDCEGACPFVLGPALMRNGSSGGFSVGYIIW